MLDKPSLVARNHDYTKAYLLLQKSLLLYLKNKLKDVESAQDIVQEAFVKAMIAEQKDKISDLNAWIKRVVKNALVDHYRQQAKMYPVNENEPIEEAFLEEELSEEVHHIFAQFLRPFAEKLPPKYAEPILLKDFEGKSIQQIAEILDISQSAVKSRLSRGRLKLKERLLECCEVEIDAGLVSDFRPKHKWESHHLI